MRNVLIAMFVLFPQVLCLFFWKQHRNRHVNLVWDCWFVNLFDYEVQWLKNRHKLLVQSTGFFFFLNDYGCGI